MLMKDYNKQSNRKQMIKDIIKYSIISGTVGIGFGAYTSNQQFKDKILSNKSIMNTLNEKGINPTSLRNKKMLKSGLGYGLTAALAGGLVGTIKNL